jgi:hypothetical protein
MIALRFYLKDFNSKKKSILLTTVLVTIETAKKEIKATRKVISWWNCSFLAYG